MSTAARQVENAQPEAPPVDRTTLPTIKGYEEAHSFIHNRLGVPAITERTLRTHTQRGNLKSFVISNARYFAEADLLEWVLSLRGGSK